MSKKLGLTPLEVAVMNLTMGGGRKNYGEIGYMANSMFKWKIPEVLYRPRFLGVCAKGIVSFDRWAHLEVSIKMRPVVITRLGAEVIATIGKIEAAASGNLEEWRWHSQFDPFENYAQNPHKLDNFLPGKIEFAPRSDDEERLVADQVHAELARERMGEGWKNQLLFD